MIISRYICNLFQYLLNLEVHNLTIVGDFMKLSLIVFLYLIVILQIPILLGAFSMKKNKHKGLDLEPIRPSLTTDQLLNAQEDLTIVCGKGAEILQMNTSAYSFLEVTSSAIGQPLQDMLPLIYSKVHNRLKTSFQEPFVLEKSGIYYDFILKVKPIVTTEWMGSLLTLHSNTDAIRLEKDMAALKAKTEEIIKSKNMFLANMSHELRTPLNAIIGMSELLIDTQLDPTHKDLVQSINQSASVLYDIINTILDFSKLEANQMGLESVTMDIPKIIGEIETIFSHQASVKKIDLKFDVSRGIPTVKGDPVRLRQILVNMIGNAIKFTHIGSVSVNVRVVSSDHNKAVIEFAIIDTGIGFPLEVKDKIFDPFIQEDDSMTRKFGGTGLGLPICKSLVQLHNGEIKVTSAVGKGSEFIVLLPYLIDPNNYTFDYKKVITKPSMSAKILVAEDNQTNQKLLKMQLKNLNYDVHIVENGQQAVEEYFENDYDIIIMDCQMPIMDGFCATLIIRQQEELFNRHIPIIALTASALKEDKEKCIECGMDDYITKPVKIETLHKTLQQWLNQ